MLGFGLGIGLGPGIGPGPGFAPGIWHGLGFGPGIGPWLGFGPGIGPGLGFMSGIAPGPAFGRGIGAGLGFGPVWDPCKILEDFERVRGWHLRGSQCVNKVGPTGVLTKWGPSVCGYLSIYLPTTDPTEYATGSTKNHPIIGWGQR